MFAYGQTGSGKSYSMVGYGQNKVFINNLTLIKGIVPITFEEIF